MDLDFTKVTYDGELSDLSEEQLRETVQEFETAQEANVAEFEKAAEATEGVDESSIEDFADARAALIEDITEAEAFGEVPLSEDKLEDEDFSDLQDWKAFVADESEDTSDDDEGGDFDDFGQESPTNPDEGTESFVEDQLGDMPGLELQE